MIKKIVFCFLVILSLSGCGEEHRFMTLCRNEGSAVPCKCMYNEISKQVKDMKHYNDWLIVFQKLNENPSLSTIQEAKKLQASMGEELWEQYICLLTRYNITCAMDEGVNVLEIFDTDKF